MPITQILLTAAAASQNINVYGYSNPMNEGSTNYAYVDWTNYPATTIYWQIVNNTTTSADWNGGITPSGSFGVDGTGSTSFNWTSAADLTTEGDQYYYLQVGTSSGGSDILNVYLTLNDTSPAPPFIYNDFTIEWWQKMLPGGGANPRPWSVGLYNTQKIAVSYEGKTSDYYWINDSAIGFSARNHVNQGWEHMAFVRRNGAIKGYVNGQQYFSSNNGNLPITSTTTPLYVGTGEIAAGTFQGYIKDMHVIKGYAKYTGNFTPSVVPIQPQTGSVYLLPVTSDLTKYDDSVGSKVGSVVNTVTYAEDDPYTWPSQNFTALAYGGGNIAINSPFLSTAPVIGLKVSDSSGWTDYVFSTAIPNHVTFFSSVPQRLPGEVYTIGEETSPLTILISQTSSLTTLDVVLSTHPDRSGILAVKAGWTFTDPAANTGTITEDAIVFDEATGHIKLTVPTASTGSWTFTPPADAGGSLYFNGGSYINYGASIDWAIDVDGISQSGLTLNIDSNNPISYPGSGSTWTDLASYGNMTLVGSPTYDAGVPSYINFNGASQYATGTATDVLPAANYSKMVWFRLNTTAADNNLVSSDAGGHYMFFSGGTKLYAGHANVPPYQGAGAFGSTSTFSAGAWCFAAVTFSVTNGIKLYVNGVLDASDPTYQTPHNGNGSTNVGCFGAGGNLLNGRIGRVICYNRELTAQEILINFNATRSRYGV